MSENGKLVWISESQRGWLSMYRDPDGSWDVVSEVISQWDAAPADPAWATQVALNKAERDGFFGSYGDLAKAVLAALGVPQSGGNT